MTTRVRPWGPLFDEPVFVFTADQDWAPEWAARLFLERVQRHEIPIHVFRTNPCEVLDAAAAGGAISQGWHPNFLPGSSHGSTTEEVVAYCQRTFPGATTARGHAFAENSYHWRALAAAGITADSQGGTSFQGYLAPLLHWTGMIRLPVYLEDDLFFEHFSPDLSLETARASLLTPGLKVLNFHPIHVACNTPSVDFYNSHRSQIYDRGRGKPPAFLGRGTVDVLDELVGAVAKAGLSFHAFEDVVAKVRSHVACDKSLGWLR